MFASEFRLEQLAHVFNRDIAARLYPGAKPRPPRTLQRLHVHRGGDEYVGESSRLGAGEAAWSDADDLQRLLPATKLLAAPPWVRSEPACPETVADDGDRMSARLHVVGTRQETSQRRLQPE